jgi:hypothetical protein
MQRNTTAIMSNEITVSGRKSITNLAVHRAIVDNSGLDLWISCGYFGGWAKTGEKKRKKRGGWCLPGPPAPQRLPSKRPYKTPMPLKRV